MHKFFKSEDGYVAVLGVISLIAFVGMGLLIIDVSRGNNAHSDLQAAADSLALAGARELDGTPAFDGDIGAIARAKNAMAELTNSVSLLEPGGDGLFIELEYQEGSTAQFRVEFLSAIPGSTADTDVYPLPSGDGETDSDKDPITEAWLTTYSTTDDTQARYVYVRAEPVGTPLLTFFINPATGGRETVPVAAEAVATFDLGVCKVPPVYICNPENEILPDGSNSDPAGTLFLEAWEKGEYHGKSFELLLTQNPAGPGNFGLLSVDGKGLNSLRDFIADSRPPICFDQTPGDDTDNDTKPGVNAAVRQGFNVMFDEYQAVQPKEPFWPAPNVRRTDRPTGSIGFTANTGTPIEKNGGIIGTGEWDLDTYWRTNFPQYSDPDPTYDPDIDDGKTEAEEETEKRLEEYESLLKPSSYADMNRWLDSPIYPIFTDFDPDTQAFLDLQPSRHDVYLYELEVFSVTHSDDGSVTISLADEGAVPDTDARPDLNHTPDGTLNSLNIDRRIITTAVANCPVDPGRGTIDTLAYTDAFVTNYMPPGNSSIKLEIQEVYRAGEVNTFQRPSTDLVR
ncbi:TadE/TadG family type IV pilus assembly protein [Rhodovulum sp. YNF3179]|uniref:TadE/TadG family type IV pilus assembly protein n=1 Tax=Rhodovulum sp. YNF3179 TaxID=3425127 RepID=UPI003D353046